MKKNRTRLLFWLSIFILVIFGVIAYLNEKALDENRLYTIGKPIKVWYVNFRYEYTYTFEVEGRRYEGRSEYSNLRPKEALGRWFYIEFEEGNPCNSKILFDKPVIDTSIVIPPGGLRYIYEDNYHR